MKKIAVVRPMVYHNVEMVLTNLAYWEQDGLQGCLNSDSSTVDLIFWFHRSLECNPSVIESTEHLLAALPKTRKCFNRVHFLNANIPEELDYYGDGTIMMFYRAMRHPFIKEHYSYIFYMEPDVLPVQAYWIDALWTHTRVPEPFWQKGTDPSND